MRTYGWDFQRELDILGNLRLAFLNRAFQIHVGDLLAQIGLRVHQSDQTVLDLDADLGTGLNGLEQRSDGLDAEGRATVIRLALAIVAQTNTR